MSVLVKIEATLDTMSPGDRQIGQYIVERPEQVLRLSSAALATETGTSQSSIVKFSQKLGFSGYSDLKLAVSEARARRQEIPDGLIHGTIQAGDDYPVVLKKLIGSKLMSIQQTLQVNREQDIHQALELLTTGTTHQPDRRRRLVVGGPATSPTSCRNSGTTFSMTVTFTSRWPTRRRSAPVTFCSRSPTPGPARETVKIAQFAKERGAKGRGGCPGGQKPSPCHCRHTAVYRG